MKGCMLSIIMPIFNVEAYIRECLESILNNDFDNLELICIDDCSADRSIDIVHEYKKNDSRIKIIKNEKNKGLSFSRNKGIEEAIGKYIWFIDSDDRVKRNVIREIIEKAEHYNTDILLFDVDVFSSDVGREELMSKRRYGAEENICKIGEEVFINYIGNGLWDSAVWRRLYRRDFIINNRLFFQDGLINEDVLHSFLSILRAKRVVYTKNVVYEYRVRDGSITTDSRNDSHRVASFCVILKIIADRYYCTKEHTLKKAIDSFLYQELLDVVNRIKKMDSLDRVQLRRLGDCYRYLRYGMLGVYNGFFPFLLSPETMGTIRNAEHIVLYGVGNVGQGLYELLEARGVHISCFAESEILKKKEAYGLPIYSIMDIPYKKDDTVVLIMAKSDSAQDFMKERAIRNGFDEKKVLLYREIAGL